MIATKTRYIDQRLIGRGAYGEVFEATDSVLQRQVAIKRYFRSAGDLVQVVSALELWTELNHPNIAQVLDYSNLDDQLSLVMTYCSNSSLDLGVNDRKSDQGQVAKLFLQICSAVGYMHEQGLIHRDLKLANVLLDSTNSPVLIDLDLCVRDDSPEVAKIVGTLTYMAPELLNGGSPSCRKTDQYALGIMLFEMLSGLVLSQHPESTSGKVSLERIFELNSSIPRYRDWNAVIAKATHIDPKVRYGLIPDLADDVERLIDGKPISARVQSQFERISLWFRKNPSTGVLLSVVVGCLVSGFLLASFSWSRTAKARNSIVSNTLLLERRIDEAKLRKNELATLLTNVQQELSFAENAERKQQMATRVAQASQQKWQAEADRAVTLTAELDSLLAKATVSAKAVDSAQKRHDIADDRLSSEKQKDYRQKVNDIWGCVQKSTPLVATPDWDSASRLLEQLPPELGGIERKIITHAIDYKLRTPVRIQLGATQKQFGIVETIGKLNLGKEYYLGGLDGSTISFGQFKRHSYARLNNPMGGYITFDIAEQTEIPKVVGLLTDGAVLVAEAGDAYSVLTYSPDSYEPWKVKTQRTKMNSEMESRIDENLVPLLSSQSKSTSIGPASIASNSHTNLNTKDQPAPPGLDPSEVKAWDYCSSIAAQVMLSPDYRNIVSIQSAQKNVFDHEAFSTIGSLTRLKNANFAYSGITDDCLVSLSKCTELQDIRLSNAVNISDAGIRELKSLWSLRKFDISNTKASLEGIDKSLLDNLEYLLLNGTKLGTTRLAKLATCKSLRELDFSTMSIVDQDLIVLKELSSLKVLKIAGREVSLENIDASLLKNLDYLVLTGIVLGPSRLSKLSACKKLRSIDLSSLDIVHEDLAVLKSLTSLRVLRIAGKEISLESLDESILKKLNSLTLYGISLGPSRLSKLSVCKDLREITFQSTELSDLDLDVFDGTSNLKRISLLDTPVSNARVEQLRKELPNCKVTTSSSPSRSNQSVEPKVKPGPAGLDPSELKAWTYFANLPSQIGLSSDNRNIVSIEIREQKSFDEPSFASITSLSRLNRVMLTHSQITDRCLISLAKCSGLQTLSLANTTGFSQDGFREINKLRSLKFLNIGDSKASLELIDEAVLANIEHLVLNGTTMGPSRLSKLSACTKLSSVGLSRMDIDSQDLKVLMEVRLLKSLNIADTKASLEFVDEAILENIEQLVLNGTTMGPSRLSKLSFCKKLMFLSVSSMDVNSQDLKVFNDVLSLKDLVISGTKVSLDLLDDSLLERLEYFVIDGKSIGTSRLSKLSACTKLRTLGISAMELEDKDFEVFKKTPSLNLLSIGSSIISDRGFDSLADAPHLKQIELKGTPVSEKSIELLKTKLPTCRVIVLPNPDNLLPPVDSKDAWAFYAMETSVGRMTQNPGEMALEMTKLGAAHWHIQMYSRGIALTEGGRYRVVLTARSTTNSTVEIEAGQASGKYSSVGLRERIALTPEFKRYEYSFTVKGQEQEKSRVGLLLGLGLGKVEIRAFELIPL